MKKKIKARKTRKPAKRLLSRKLKAKKKSNKVTIHPSGKSIKVSASVAHDYRVAKRTA